MSIGASEMHNLVRARRHDVFFDQHLNSVGNWLEKAEWPDAIWSITILDASEDFSFEHGHRREEREKKAEQRPDVDQCRYGLRHPIRRARDQREQPLLRVDEDLIDGFNTHPDEEKRCAIL